MIDKIRYNFRMICSKIRRFKFECSMAIDRRRCNKTIYNKTCISNKTRQERRDKFLKKLIRNSDGDKNG